MAHHGVRFHLTGIDVAGIDAAREIAAQQGWIPTVTLRQGSGYDLAGLFAPQSFDIIVATQVLERVARLIPFMKQVERVLKRDGEAFFTLDSGHWRSRFDFHDPVRLAKSIVKKSLASFGNEKHYDLPWLDYELAAACNEVGLELVECRYFNLPPLKWIHNDLLPLTKKNVFIQLWYELEEFINDDVALREKVKNCFLVIYLHVRKAGTHSTSLSYAQDNGMSHTPS